MLLFLNSNKSVMQAIIGRIAEQEILARKLATGNPELIAIYGRRRVGKTYLIRAYLKDNIAFEMAGIHGVLICQPAK